MHTYVSDDGTQFHYKGDMTGDVQIVLRTAVGPVAVPAKCILQFVAEYLRGEAISKLEKATVEQVLGLEE